MFGGKPLVEENVVRKAAYASFYVTVKHPYGVKVKRSKPLWKVKKKIPFYAVTLAYNFAPLEAVLTYPVPRTVVANSLYAITIARYYKRPLLVIAEFTLDFLSKLKMKVKGKGVRVPGKNILQKLEDGKIVFDGETVNSIPRYRKTNKPKTPLIYMMYGLEDREHGKAYFVFIGNVDRLEGLAYGTP